MILSREYQIVDTLFENENIVVYRAKRLEEGENVIIKMIKPSAREGETISQFVNEETILCGLKSTKIPKLLTAISQQNFYIHVFEDIGGHSLYNVLAKGKPSLTEALYIAAEIAEIVRYLHKKHIIHADINPKNIIYNAETRQLQLIDFGYSVMYNDARFRTVNKIGTSGNLLYMSPEQTGRTKERVDYRSDIYSMGMTFYHLFSGSVPFKANDQYELIHKQIALTPPLLSDIHNDIPLVLSQIVHKMIEKKPIERYQSDDAILYDLQKCIQAINEFHEIPLFTIASMDFPVISIGEHLYGRKDETAVLKQAIYSARQRNAIKVIVSGHSGVGKTRLIEEFLGFFNPSETRILRSKFEQYKATIPYFAFKQLFLQLHVLLIARIRQNRSVKISASSARVLNHVFPELHDIFPQIANGAIRITDDLKHQLPYALKELFAQIATRETMLILFMDDLQWADAASIELIKQGILEGDNPYLHFVGCYRSNEIIENSSAFNMITAMEKNFPAVIHLSDLSLEDFKTMLHDVLREHGKKFTELVALLYKKTDGNPFYIKTFLSYLIDSGELRFEQGRWQYDIKSIKMCSATTNIAAIFNAKFDKLNQTQRCCLQHLALLGNRFDLALTYEIFQFIGQPISLIDEFERDGFIEIFGGNYQFVHDQIQQYIFNTMDSSIQRSIHRSIGKYLENAYRLNQYKDVISLVNHLNQGESGKNKSVKLFVLNLEALDELIISSGYASALELTNWIDEHFSQNIARYPHKYRFRYNELKTKAYYLNARHDKAYALGNGLSKQARSLHERIAAFSLIKNICVTQGKRFNELLGMGNELLREMDFVQPGQGKELEYNVAQLLRKIKNHKLYKNPDLILDLPTIKNDKKQILLTLLVDYWEASFYTSDIVLMQWAFLNIIDTSFRFGNASESTFGYVLYGSYLMTQKEYKQGYRFGEVALKLNQKFDDRVMLPKVHNFVANFINPYIKPIRTNVPLYQKSLHQSKINGDIVFGTWANFLMHLSDYFAGKSLDALQENMREESSFILNSGDTKMIAIYHVLLHTLRLLQDEETGLLENTYTMIDLWEKDHFYPGLGWYAIINAQTAFLYGNFDEGLGYLNRYLHTDANEVIMFPKIRLHFIRSLLLLAKDTVPSETEEKQLASDLKECDAIMQAAPATYKFGKLLLKAERMKKERKTWDVAHLYDAALNEARKQKNPFFIALAGLCGSRFWSRLQLFDLYRVYLNEAIVGLNQWGAYGLVEYLRSTQHINSDKKNGSVTDSWASVPGSTRKADAANFQSLLKSFYAISKELDKNELLKTLMQTILENATANKAILILKEGDEFQISASLDFEKAEVQLCSAGLRECPSIPHSMISLVIEQGSSLVVENPAGEGAFQYDEYIREIRPASCTVIPTVIEGVVKGILYLENKEIVTPLSAENIHTLELLLTQAAIVFKNTALYENIKKSEDNLNKAQQISHVGSWQYNSADDSIVWSAETYRIYDLEPFSISVDNQWFIDHLHPDDIEYVNEAVNQALNGQRYYDVIHRIITSTGAVKTVHQRAETFWEGDYQKMSGTIQDITVSKRAEEMISRLSQVVDQNPFSTIITDTNGVIEYVNKQSLSMSGYFAHELIGQKMSILSSGIHTEDFYYDLWKTISTDMHMWRGTIYNRMKNGNVIDCSSTIFPIFNSDNIITNFVTIQEDLTEQHIKDKLFLMQTRQAQMGEMLSMIAHQWRQPLAIISALMNKNRIDIILQKATFESVTENYDQIEMQVQYLSRTISDFRDFFKPDKQATSTKNSTIISKALGLIEHSLNQKSIQVNVEYHNDNLYMTFEHEMVQVILNLVKNAQDAIVEREVVNPVITIVTDQYDEVNVITIEDNGGGIDPKIINSLFLPYVSTKREQNGTGLGLYMCKTIIEEHAGGSLSVENTAQGAKFSIRIPLREQHG